MKNVIFITICFIVPAVKISAQVMTIDPLVTVAIGTASIAENSQIADMKSNQTAIIAAQSATTALVGNINNLQQKTLDGLSKVSSVVRNAYQIVEAYNVLLKIYDYQSRMLAECVKDPLATILAYRVEKEMVTKALRFYTQIATLILQEGTDNLMDSGDRNRLMNQILSDLQTIEGYSFNCYFSVHLAVLNGVVRSLNPFNQYINNDGAIVNHIMANWKL